jgi:predicted Zn finger-like uncharacterized protein
MSSADLATVVIACPNCGMRYQVPYGTLGKDGREVQCAQCGQSWHATADAPPPPAVDPDALFSTQDEVALDLAFEEEARAATPALPATQPVDPDHVKTLAEIRAAIAPKPKLQPVNSIDPALLKKATRSFDKRQRAVRSKQPFVRLRRTARLGALVALMALLLLGFSLRIDIVRLFPSLAGLYASIGMPVNVVGLEFTDAKTLMSLRNDKTVMQITAKIHSMAGATVSVPPVLVSLLNDAGATVYEWTVAPEVKEMEPGEVMDFSTEVNSPPDGAVRVRLSFTTARGDTAAASP